MAFWDLFRPKSKPDVAANDKGEKSPAAVQPPVMRNTEEANDWIRKGNALFASRP